MLWGIHLFFLVKYSVGYVNGLKYLFVMTKLTNKFWCKVLSGSAHLHQKFNVYQMLWWVLLCFLCQVLMNKFASIPFTIWTTAVMELFSYMCQFGIHQVVVHQHFHWPMISSAPFIFSFLRVQMRHYMKNKLFWNLGDLVSFFFFVNMLTLAPKFCLPIFFSFQYIKSSL